MKKIIAILTILLSLECSIAENIDPYNDNMQYAWSENTGWLNFEPDTGNGVQVQRDSLTGFIWSENIGWINLSPMAYGGVFNDGNGNLSGYAWSENVGWINFNPVVAGDPTDYGVKIDIDGTFFGYAWSENIGWINFGLVNLADYYVVACKVTFEDLANFVEDWLGTGPGNLDGIGDVDFNDYSIFASYWLDYCPDNWPLK